MIKRFLALLAVSLLALFGIAAPAQAIPPNNCGAAFICLYDPTNFGTAGMGYRAYQPANILSQPGDCLNFDANFKNRASSLINNMSANDASYVTIYPNDNCQGAPVLSLDLINSPWYDTDLSNTTTWDPWVPHYPTNFSNAANSIYYYDAP